MTNCPDCEELQKEDDDNLCPVHKAEDDRLWGQVVKAHQPKVARNTTQELIAEARAHIGGFAIETNLIRRLVEALEESSLELQVVEAPVKKFRCQRCMDKMWVLTPNGWDVCLSC